MKKTFFTFLVASLLVFNGAFAQDSEESQGLKGAWWALGQLEFNDNDVNDVSTFTVLPVVGTFISPTITLGLGAGYTTTTSGDSDAVSALIIMPLVRNYWSLNEKFYIFGQADVPLIFGDGYTGYGFNLSPGIDYFVSSKVTIEATFGQFGYNAVKPENGDTLGSTSLGVNLMEINFGIKLIL
ncbi:MAG: hypothetical protein P8P73_04480 [Flavobacteriaceae bacterium]|jgi:outer membrane immunogenic protein|nr:porin family protein [Bacteroidota bacterium]MDC3312544.1 hypothetical protein [Flavobacteriaceae bacterium]MDG1379241.1 hypothetical protein [Flavobacteriaceae bacterium]MDG2351119.1 hypothetical protein [Flavobacteriaceae bacterium]|tara:strand:- start:3419 stop:3967 length:549 start_codon:yes stop_codon:yes gene_type:complete